jgi:hypothetical protein
MMILKKAVPRRAVLRGLGATVALPLLDAMVPAFTALAQSPARPVRRFGITYVAMGQARNIGGEIDYWTPKTVGQLELSQILQPLAPYRDQLVVISGLDNKPGDSRLGDPGGAHSRVCPAWLSGVHPKPTVAADFEAGTTIDQIAARELGKQTELPSLEMSLFSTEFAGACETGYSCAYTNTVSWASPNRPLPMENNPRAVFERLFGDSGSTDPQVRLARMRTNRSILDSVSDKARRLTNRLGSRDRVKLTEYLESIRGIEARIQKAEQEKTTQELPRLDSPAGIPDAFPEYCQLMYDLQLLAFQADLTRVITFMMVRDLSQRAYPECGVPDAQHAISHHQEDPATIAKYAKVNSYHVSMFGYFLEKMRTTNDGDGSLLDHSLLLYGSAMGNSNRHDPKDLPMMLAGGGAGRLQGGRHLRYEQTPVSNLYMTLLDKLGAPTDRIGDADGQLEGLWNL